MTDYPTRLESAFHQSLFRKVFLPPSALDFLSLLSRRRPITSNLIITLSRGGKGTGTPLRYNFCPDLIYIYITLMNYA